MKDKINRKLYVYYRNKYIEYRNKILKEEEEREFDIYKIIHNNEFICGIDNGICEEELCTSCFHKKGCMYLKGVYKR